MKAKDVMTSPVITVAPETPLQEVVDLLLKHRISGMPVLSQDRVVGMIGDGDLLHRHEIGTDHGEGYRPWWQRLTQSDAGPVAYVRTHGGRVQDVMSRDVVCVREDAPLAELAVIFEKRHIRRLPVLRGERLTGLVTRADLVRALSTHPMGPADVRAKHDDEAIRSQLMSELDQQSWWSGNWSGVFVQNGVVRFVGLVPSEADRQAARVAAENIPGVRAVEDKRQLQEAWMPIV